MYQYSESGVVRDWIFVVILLVATCILILGMGFLHKYLLKNIPRFFRYTMEGKNDLEVREASLSFCDFKVVPVSISGIIYGVSVASSVFILKVWPDLPTLRCLLFVFLFFVNFVTGVALFSVVLFTYRAWKISGYVKVDIWERSNLSTEIYRKITQSIALVGGFYAFLCISGIWVSVFPVSTLTIGYSVFSGMVILSLYIFPKLPIRLKIKRSKRENLEVVSSLIRDELKKVFRPPGTQTPPVAYDYISSLLNLRDRIERTPTWPFELKSLLTTSYMGLVTILPVIIQIIIFFRGFN